MVSPGRLFCVGPTSARALFHTSAIRERHPAPSAPSDLGVHALESLSTRAGRGDREAPEYGRDVGPGSIRALVVFSSAGSLLAPPASRALETSA
jgi:hypothetical protein